MSEQPLHSRFNRRRFLQILAVAGVAGGIYRFGFSKAGNGDHLVRQSRSLMGTEINLIVRGPDEDACLAAVRSTFDRIAALSRIFSRHDSASELAELNRHGFLSAISSELGEVLSLATTISRQTQGAFDVTVLPLLRLYKQNSIPSRAELDRALQLVDYRKIERHGQGARLTVPGMELTLDGIAKGYIVDQGIATLHAHGFLNVYVEAGGDLMVTGAKPAEQPWRIGIRPPRPQPSEAMTVIAATSSLAVATSGDYMQAFTEDLRNHHILDPRSGRSPAELASATITAPTVALADGLATAAMVLGPEQALRMLASFEHCQGLLIGKDLRQYRSAGFPG